MARHLRHRLETDGQMQQLVRKIDGEFERAAEIRPSGRILVSE